MTDYSWVGLQYRWKYTHTLPTTVTTVQPHTTDYSLVQGTVSGYGRVVAPIQELRES